jgi:hypothetical protein
MQFESAHARQTNIENDAADAIMVALFKVVLSRVKALRRKSCGLEKPFKRPAYQSIIIDNCDQSSLGLSHDSASGPPITVVPALASRGVRRWKVAGSFASLPLHD